MDLARAGKEVHPVPYVRVSGDKSVGSGLKKTWGISWQSIRAALVTSLMFRLMLVIILGEIGSH